MTEDKIRENIFRLFSSEIVFTEIDDLVIDSTDEESVEECEVFVGKRWIEINKELWNKHFRAIFFFNYSAKKNFLPSVMVNMLDKSPEIQLAFSNYVYELIKFSDNRSIFDFFDHDNNKLHCFRDWLVSMKNDKDLEFDFKKIDLMLRRIRRIQ